MLGFFRFLLWAQWLLFRDLIRGLWSGTFNCRGVEKQLVDTLAIRLTNITPRNLQSIAPDTRMIFANHRSFTDFFLDGYIAGGASNLARYMVALILPMVGLYGTLTGRGLFFHRGGTKRPQLTVKILNHLKKYKFPLIVYPEGTRYLGSSPIPLKHGVLKIAYENNLLCQIMIVHGKEMILHEKSQKISTHQECCYTFSEQITPQNSPSYEDFYKKITQIWAQSWAEAYELRPRSNS